MVSKYAAPFRILHTLLALTLFAAASSLFAAQNVDHSLWGRVLQQYVDDKGFVDYDGLLANRDKFDQYVQSLEATSPANDPTQFSSQQQQLAYYINAYNAMVFNGVLARGPERKSVWRGLISGLNFFVRMDITLGEEKTNLKKLEDKIIRAQYQDPRIHAALNCASVSCPKLIKQAYLPETLNQQLDEVMRGFVNDTLHVTIDSGKKAVALSKIFDWYGSDFIDFENAQGNTAGSKDSRLIGYINRFRAADNQIPMDYEVSFLPYDKGINTQ